MNKYINLNSDNLRDEHLCCAIGDKKHQEGVNAKKQWLAERISEGHVFRKLDAQGKVFIEYVPLESAWVPVEGDNFLHIHCLWVAGSYKGQGYGKDLLEYAIAEARKQKKSGLCTISSRKKKPFLGDKKFFSSYGFEVVDTIKDYELLVLSFDGKTPQFSDCAREMKITSKNLTIYYSPQCPYTADCVRQLQQYSAENQVKIDFVKVDTLEKARRVPCIFNNWATFKDGKFLDNTLLNKNSVVKLMGSNSKEER